MENKITLHSESSRELFGLAQESSSALLTIPKELGIGFFQRKRAYPKALLYAIFLTMVASEGLLDEKSYDNLVEDLVVQYCILNNQTSTSAVREQMKVYENAMQEKRGPKGKDGEYNWLWPLSHAGLQAIRGDEAEDAFAMTYMMQYSATIIKKTTEFFANKK